MILTLFNHLQTTSMKRIFTRFLFVALAIGFFMPQGNAVIVLPSTPTSTEPDAATVKSAMEAFRGLSKKEKKEKLREVKKALNEFKAQKKAKAAPVASTILQVIFAILIPPLGVYLHEGEIN